MFAVFVSLMKQDMNSDGAHLMSFEIDIQTRETTEYEYSPNVFSVCACLLRNVVCELEHVLLQCSGFFCIISVRCDEILLL